MNGSPVCGPITPPIVYPGTPWFGVLGTWQYEDPLDDKPNVRDWRAPGAKFSSMMDALGYYQLWSPGDLFGWDGEIAGVFRAKRNVWYAPGDELAHRLRQLPLEARRGIGHSYGGAVILRAAMQVPIHSLLTIGTPANSVVREMAAEAIKRGNLTRWVHVRDERWDRTAALGGLLDGQVSLSWSWPPIDRSMRVDGCTEILLKDIGHNSLLWEKAESSYWAEHKLLAALSDVAAEALKT